MKTVHLLLFKYENAMVIFDLYIMYVLVPESIILVLYQWYQLKECRLGKLILVKADDLNLISWLSII